MEKPMSIERIAEELGVNFYDLHSLIRARENWLIEKAKQEGIKEAEMIPTALAPLLQTAYMQGIKEVVEWVEANKRYPQGSTASPTYSLHLGWDWQAKLKEWGIGEG